MSKDIYWYEQACETCNFVPKWIENGKLLGMMAGDEIFDGKCYGRCRKNPPIQGGYPVVYPETPACSKWEEA